MLIVYAELGHYVKSQCILIEMIQKSTLNAALMEHCSENVHTEA